MIKTFKYRIYPTEAQRILIDQTLDACRLVYNLGIEIKSYAWKTQQKNVTIGDLQKQIPGLRSEYGWIKSVNSQALYATLQNLKNAFGRFYSGEGFPKFKRKHDRQSFACHNSVRRIDWDKCTLTIPKIANIPIRLSNRFDGEIKTITIIKTPTNKYFACILVDNKRMLPSNPVLTEGGMIGIDIGIKSFAVISDGRSFQPNQKLKASIKRLQCLQRRASRKQKGSLNSKKAYNKVSLLHEAIANQRSDYVHKITSQLIRDNQANTFVIEDLNVIGMMKFGNLSRSIHDASFGEFQRQMKYKCEWYGKNLIIIGRFSPSTKRCSECGRINDWITLSVREWLCPCGTVHDRDLNAAKNIKYYGLLKYSGEGISGGPVESRRLRRAKKQEVLTDMPNNSK